MKSTIEPEEGNKVKLSITVDAAEFETAIDDAWKAIAREVRIPGFRAGKAPRKVLESRIEPGAARSEALREALPGYYLDAVREHEVDAIAQPEIDITDGEESGDVTFEAVVEVRPEVEISGYDSLTVTIPTPHPSDDDIADQVDQFRGQFGELVDVSRPIATGDVVTIDLSATDDGEAVEGLTVEGYAYEVGSGVVVPELDDQLRAANAGDSLTFEAKHPQDEDTTLEFTVVAQKVQERELPDLTDEWVADATEFETVDEFRDDIITRLTTAKREQSSSAVHNELGTQLAALVDVEAPESLVASEMRARLENLIGRLQQQGLELDMYLQVTGTDPQAFTEDLRRDSIQAITVDLALRAVTRGEGLTATDEDVDAEIEKIATQADMDVASVREQLEAADQIPAVRSDVGRRNALQWLIERIDIVDESGAAVNRADLDLDLEDSDDHDHDHDHD